MVKISTNKTGAIMLRKITAVINIFALGVILYCNNSEFDINEYHAKFLINSTPKDYISIAGINMEISNYEVIFMENNYSINIAFPLTVETGKTYGYADLYEFNFVYYEPSSVLDHYWYDYRMKSGNPFSLIITKWEGKGGYAAGTFSGILTYGTKNVTISNGSFEALIY